MQDLKQSMPFQTVEVQVGRAILKIMNILRTHFVSEKSREMAVNILITNAVHSLEGKKISGFDWLSDFFDPQTIDGQLNNLKNILIGETIWLENNSSEYANYGMSAFSILEISETFQGATTESLRKIFSTVVQNVDLSNKNEISVFDPAAGTGVLLTSIYEAIPNANVKLSGQEINYSSAELLSKIAKLSRVEIEMRIGDSITDDLFQDEKFDLVVMDTPLGLKFSTDRISSEDPRFNFGIPRNSDAGWLFIQHGLSKLKSPADGGGILICTTSATNLRGGRGIQEILAQASKLDYLQAVVALPERILPYTNVPIFLLVFNNSKNAKWQGKFQFVNLRSEFDPRPGHKLARNTVSEFGLDQLKLAITRPLPEKNVRTLAEKHLVVQSIQIELTELSVSQFGKPTNVASFRHSFPPGMKVENPEFLKDPRLQDLKCNLEDLGIEYSWEVAPHFLKSSSKGSLASPSNPKVSLLSEVSEVFTLKAGLNPEEFPETFDINQCIVIPSKIGERAKLGTLKALDTTNLSQIWLKVKNEKVRTFLCEWLNTEQGVEAIKSANRNARNYLSGSTLPLITVNRDSLLQFLLNIEVPDMNDLDLIQTDELLSKVNSSLNYIEGLKNEFLNDLKSREELIELIEKINNSNSLGEWAFQLPFPLAASLQSYKSFVNDDEKAANQLLHFWEATAIFMATFLLSALKQSQQLWEIEIPNLKKALETGKCSFERATFGTWKIVIEYLSPFFLKAIQNDDADSGDRYLELLGNPPIGTAERLLDPKIVSLLNRVVSIRNREFAHTGTVTGIAAKKRRESLENLTLELQSVIKGSWQKLRLVYTGSTDNYEHGSFVSGQILMAPTTSFAQESLLVSKPVLNDRLYLMSGNGQVALLPFVQMNSAPKETLNTCYFYNRMNDEGPEMVTYQLSDDKNKILDSSGYLSKTISEMINLESSPLNNL